MPPAYNWFKWITFPVTSYIRWLFQFFFFGWIYIALLDLDFFFAILFRYSSKRQICFRDFCKWHKTENRCCKHLLRKTREKRESNSDVNKMNLSYFHVCNIFSAKRIQWLRSNVYTVRKRAWNREYKQMGKRETEWRDEKSVRLDPYQMGYMLWF